MRPHGVRRHRRDDEREGEEAEGENVEEVCDAREAVRAARNLSSRPAHLDALIVEPHKADAEVDADGEHGRGIVLGRSRIEADAARHGGAFAKSSRAGVSLWEIHYTRQTSL